MMDARLKTVKFFCELIDKGSQILTTLCRLCEEEKTAITQLDASMLQNSVNQKQEQLELLAENTLQRNQTLVTLGFSPDEQGLNQLQQDLPPIIAEQVTKRWSHLAAQLQQASALNQRNEQIVNRSQNNMARLISILQGQTAKTSIYNEAGHNGNYSAQNTLGKA